MARHRPTFRDLIPIGAILLLAIGGYAQNPTGNTIQGKVRSQGGQPVSNVIVELQSGNGMLITQTVTSNEGDYVFSGLTGASFVILVNDSRHDPLSERLEFPRDASSRPGETLRLDLTLTAKARPVETRGAVVFRQTVPETAVKAYQAGMKLVSEGRSEAGIARLQEATTLSPDYFDAHFALGLTLFRAKRYDDAIGELERARAINPRDGRLYYTFGLVLIEKKNFDLAAKVFQACEQLDPRNAEAHLLRAMALIEIGQLIDAEPELKTADQLADHKLDHVHTQLARVYERQGKYARAADELEKYLAENPKAENASAIRNAVKQLRSR
jgi:tetratricopeptide (TPR) repeat protein